MSSQSDAPVHISRHYVPVPSGATIEEIQLVPELTLALKRNVDAKRRPSGFLLTGSATPAP